MNILVCTPGRLLQHMDETPGFEAGDLQMLVLDEADRILDMVRAPLLHAPQSSFADSFSQLLWLSSWFQHTDWCFRMRLGT